jgi:hypothetical protein
VNEAKKPGFSEAYPTSEAHFLLTEIKSATPSVGLILRHVWSIIVTNETRADER